MSNNYWRLDGNGWAVNIDKADCEWLRDEIIKDLVDMLDDEDMEELLVKKQEKVWNYKILERYLDNSQKRMMKYYEKLYKMVM